MELYLNKKFLLNGITQTCFFKFLELNDFKNGIADLEKIVQYCFDSEQVLHN